jgi:cobalt-zinc-cadmium efflux system outer membrane protein
MRLVWRSCIGCALVGCFASNGAAQTPLTWADVRARFEGNNPTLRAGQIGIDEARAQELSAFLRPNPQLTVGADSINLFESPAGSGVFDNMLTVAAVSYLHERNEKRELRRDSAQAATAIATSGQADLDRNLVLALRGAFVQLLQAKAFLALAQAELGDYDQFLTVSRARLQNGDIAQVDQDRLELQRVQYESDVQTATVNLRSAKIQLLRLLNDNTSIDQFDVTGPFDFAPIGRSLDEVRQLALTTRPDLKAAVQAVDKARTDYRLAVANGSTDPTISGDVGWPQQPNNFTPPVNFYVGVSLSIPLRIFDSNQGEKQRTQLDISRSERLADAARAQVVSDVDTAYNTVVSTVSLLQSYRASYLDQATRIRDSITFSYQSGGASLIDFLQAQQEYRTVQISFVNLVGAFLNAVSQLNFAVGQEVIP